MRNAACVLSRPLTDCEIEFTLSVPTPDAIAAVARLDGDHLALGASGKMGVTLAAMTRRALDATGKRATRVLGVARFRDAAARATLEHFGVVPVACALSDFDAVMRLPDAANVQYLAGQKFGTDSAPEETWIENAVVPSHVARRFCASRIVVFSTGCAYPLTPIDTSGLPSRPAGAKAPIGRCRPFAATRESRHLPAQTLAHGHPLRCRRVRLPPRLSRRIHFPIQPPQFGISWQAVLPPRSAGGPSRAHDLRGPLKPQPVGVDRVT